MNVDVLDDVPDDVPNEGPDGVTNDGLTVLRDWVRQSNAFSVIDAACHQ